ncbi:hypothetical protein HYS91_00025 [Candidatus Daviesbacteria bacterium]|nr:hypothetical protein [Candidatus Daviesbacteria bacterium]
MEESASPIIIQRGSNKKSLLPSNAIDSLPKLIFVGLVIIIIGELIWGAWYLLQPIPKREDLKKVVNIVETKNTATISLSSDKTNYKVGENVTVNIEVESLEFTDGTDLILKYDPTKLRLEGNANTVFTKGNLYPEYLALKIDNSNGVFSVSGTSTPESKSEPGSDFGTLKFKAITSGATTINIDFTPGVSTDSNVIDAKTSGDILDNALDLEVIIN